MNCDLKITTFPRIHITLIGMNSDGYRINGGIGFSISDPKIMLRFCKSDDLEIYDNREKPFSQEEKKRLTLTINNIYKEFDFKNSFVCNIYGNCNTHVGLGTGTSITLACVEALFIINNHCCPVNRNKIIFSYLIC